jgi:uncharacterized membrane protein YfcA
MSAVLFGAIAIGITLGLLGSGGSILTVPVLAYLVGQDEKVAIAGSLVIVGVIAFFASIPQIYKKNVDWRSVIYFGIPGMLGTYIGAWLAGYVSGAVQFTAFALIMLFAAWKMLVPAKEHDKVVQRAYWKILADGLIVGAITGFVGVGGGFLIVPALALLGGLSMHRAVATSLVIIVMKSTSGFYKYQDVLEQLNLALDWNIIGIISAVGIIGSFAGSKIGQSIPQEKMKKVFGTFLILMAGYIAWQSVPMLLA